MLSNYMGSIKSHCKDPSESISISTMGRHKGFWTLLTWKWRLKLWHDLAKPILSGHREGILWKGQDNGTLSPCTHIFHSQSRFWHKTVSLCAYVVDIHDEPWDIQVMLVRHKTEGEDQVYAMKMLRKEMMAWNRQLQLTIDSWYLPSLSAADFASKSVLFSVQENVIKRNQVEHTKTERNVLEVRCSFTNCKQINISKPCPTGFVFSPRVFSVSKMETVFLTALLSLRRSPTLSSWRSIMHFKHLRSSDLRFNGFWIKFGWPKMAAISVSQAAKQPRLYFVLEYCDSLGVVCCFQSRLLGYFLPMAGGWKVLEWSFFFLDPFNWKGTKNW